MDKRDKNKGVIFAACFIEKGYARGHVAEYSYFLNYNLAYDYLKAQKQEYLDDDALKDVITYGEIRRVPIDTYDDFCEKGSLLF